MDEDLLRRARKHAKENGTTFNQMVRDLLAREVAEDRGRRTCAMFELADRLNIKAGPPLSREEAHERG